MEWYGWLLLACGWMAFGIVTIFLDYHSQTDVKHRDSLSYEELLLNLVAGPIGIPLQLVANRRQRRK